MEELVKEFPFFRIVVRDLIKIRSSDVVVILGVLRSKRG